jgi:hypothetical protein
MRLSQRSCWGSQRGSLRGGRGVFQGPMKSVLAGDIKVGARPLRYSSGGAPY